MRIASLWILGLAAWPALAGNIYKWKDAQGQLHYSQTPPARGTVQLQPQNHVQSGIRLQAPVPAASATTAPPVAKPATDANAPAPAPETKQAKAQRCSESQQRLVFLEEHPARRLFVKGADGSESRMTEEEHAARVVKAQEAGKGC